MTRCHEERCVRCFCVGHALKESLSAADVLQLLCSAAAEARLCVTGSLCISDGGDGFLEAWRTIDPAAETIHVPTFDPLGRRMIANYLYNKHTKSAIIESAEIVGLRLVAPTERNILASSTAGLGDLVADAIERGADTVYVGVGGTATCDGGLGFLARLTQRLGIAPTGIHSVLAASLLMNPPELDFHMLRRRLAHVRMVACLDVEAPLTGKEGAAYQFAPQKGATTDEVEWLDIAMRRWGQTVENSVGERLSDKPGTGAGGGLGFALMALGAKACPGASVFTEQDQFREGLLAADVMVTAEGKFDRTSLRGKAPWRAALAARNAGKRAMILCARADTDAIAVARQHGVDVVTFAPDLKFQEACLHTRVLVRQAVVAYARENLFK